MLVCGVCWVSKVLSAFADFVKCRHQLLSSVGKENWNCSLHWIGEKKIHIIYVWLASSTKLYFVSCCCKSIYLSTTAIFRYTHIAMTLMMMTLMMLLLLMMMIINFSRNVSSHTICTTISLAITAHEFSFSLSSLSTHYILINGIDIYYIQRRIFFSYLFICGRERERKDMRIMRWSLNFTTSLCEDVHSHTHSPVPCAFPPPAPPPVFKDDGTLSKRGRAISTSLEKCFKHVNAVFLSASHSIVCCFD